MATDRAQLHSQMRLWADGLAAAVAAILPWSTSGTLIAIAAWLIVLIPTLKWEDLRDALRHPAAYLPVALFLLAALGMLWSDVSWKERLSGLYPYSRLLLLPLLFVQFRDSDRRRWIPIAFLLSCSVVLAASYANALTGYRFGLGFRVPGVPVRDYIAQAGEFTLCAMGLLYLAMNYWSERKTAYLFAAVALAMLFLANIVFVFSSRTALVTLPLLLVLFAVTQFRLSQTFALFALIGFACAAIWFSSTMVQRRLSAIYTEVQIHQANKDIETSAGQRVEFWRQAGAILRRAPILGHGTGTVRDRYRKQVAADGLKSKATTNPHNQTLMVAIQLGVVGALLLIAIWIAHFALFVRGVGLAAWLGLVIVAQNVIGGLFNTHLFDFLQGWLYIFGVGVMGGAVLSQRPDGGRARS